MSIGKATREHCYKRDKHQCVRCHGKEDLTCDHVIPLSLDGGKTNKLRNLQTMCFGCNTAKGNTVVSYTAHPATRRHLKFWGYLACADTQPAQRRVIKICQHCGGSGLERCEENHNIPAKNHHEYVVCKSCNGEGVPKTQSKLPVANKSQGTYYS